MTELHVVFGASGGIGNAVVRSLVRKGKSVRGVNRTGAAVVPDAVEVVAANLLNTSEAERAAEGATHIYNCVNVPYRQWQSEFPKITAAFIELLRRSGARGIIADNLYMYGEGHNEPYNEDMPFLATGKKGQLRAQCARINESAMEEGEITALICRAPDFYGPGVTNSYFGDRLFPNVLDGKDVRVFGNPDMIHAIIYVDDFAEALTTLALDPDAYGQVWHAPMDIAVSQREFIEQAYSGAKTSGSIKGISSVTLNVLGLFVPILREVKELMYEFNSPHEVNSSKFESRYEIDVTPHEEGIRNTLEWYRSIQTARHK